jgi:hypothetical protein
MTLLTVPVAHRFSGGEAFLGLVVVSAAVAVRVLGVTWLKGVWLNQWRPDFRRRMS